MPESVGSICASGVAAADADDGDGGGGRLGGTHAGQGKCRDATR